MTDNHASMIELPQPVTQQIIDDLCAAFPGVNFTLVAFSNTLGKKPAIQIEWCGDPPYTAVAAVTDKYKDVIDIILDWPPTPAGCRTNERRATMPAMETMFIVEVDEDGLSYGPFETADEAALYASRFIWATVSKFSGVLTSSQEITREEYDRLIEGRTLVPPTIKAITTKRAKRMTTAPGRVPGNR